MDLSKDDVFKIIKMIEESGYDDVRLEIGDFKLHVQKHASGAPVVEISGQREAPRTQPAAAERSAGAPAFPGSRSGPADEFPDGVIVVRAPMLGTFYRAPAPGEKPFVEVGARVSPDDTIGLVEVMKLFSSIKAGAAGSVLEILVENAAMVEHGQPLMIIQPE